MKPKGLLQFALVAIAFWAGIFFYMKRSERGPASVKGEVMDYSDLEHTEFIDKAKVRIIEGIELKKAGEQYELKLGHVYGPARSVSMCEKYTRLVFVFHADGVAVSGQSPSLYVAGACKADESLSQTAALILPFKELTHSKPFDGSKTFANSDIMVENLVNNEWPYELYLHSVSLIDAGTSEAIHISLSELRQHNRGNFNISFWD